MVIDHGKVHVAETPGHSKTEFQGRKHSAFKDECGNDSRSYEQGHDLSLINTIIQYQIEQIM